MTQPNFQRLSDVVKATEEVPLGGFSMAHVALDKSCGTVGCMIGNYNKLVGRYRYCFGPNADEPDHEYFGITESEYAWLFCDGTEFKLATQWERYGRSLSMVTREQAIARLLKFIAYKLHKSECGGMTYEEMRRAEGDHHFVNRSLEPTAPLPVLPTAPRRSTPSPAASGVVG